MAGPYDIAAKDLIHRFPRAWLTLVGHLDPGEVAVLDTDLSTVAPQADIVLRVSAPAPHLVHIELQASADPRMGLRLARYNLLLQERYGLPVLSVLVLLRREADGPSMRGTWHSAEPTGRTRHTFEYPVVRVWTESAQRVLEGPLGLVPLAPLATADPAALPEIVRATRRRIHEGASASDAALLDVVTYILMGLKYPAEIADQFFPGIRTMRESSTYMAILNEGIAEGEARGRAEGEARGRAEGRAAEARSLLLLMGTAKLGPPDDATRAALERIEEVDRLERMGPRLLSASSWDQLLATV